MAPQASCTASKLGSFDQHELHYGDIDIMGYQPTSTNNQPGFHFRLPHIESFFQDGEVPIKCTGDYLHHGFHLMRIVLNCKVTVWHLACGFFHIYNQQLIHIKALAVTLFMQLTQSIVSSTMNAASNSPTDIMVQHSYDLVKPWGWSLLAKYHV